MWRRKLQVRSPQLTNRYREHRVADGRVRPDRLQERRLRHELAWLRDEMAKHREGLGRERTRLRSAPQPLVPQVNPEVFAPQDGGLLHGAPRQPCFDGPFGNFTTLF